MAVVPSTLNLQYKQLSEVYETKIVNYIEPGYSAGRPEVSREIIVNNKPNWINIYKQANGEARVNLNPEVSSLSGGLKIANVVLRMSIVYEDISVPGETYTQEVTLGNLELRLDVQSTINLSANPNPVLYNYQLGAVSPSAKNVSIQSESGWNITKTKNWTSISTSSGFGIGNFSVSVNPIGLAAGTHTDVLTITDDLFTINVPVSLIITEADTETTFLYVQPSTMTINYTVSGYLPIRQVELNASGNWIATPSASWLAISQTSGTEGVAFFELTLNEAEALTLTEGVYLATVLFEQGGLVKTIYVTLNVYQLVESLLNDIDLYFTDDDNKIILSSLREDTFLALEVASSFENNVKSGFFAIPFYAGRGERRIGNFPKKVIGQRPIPLDVDDVKLFVPYAPALINLTITEEDIVSDQVFQTVPVDNVQFIKGETPISGWLSEMPQERFLTKKGIAAFSFLSGTNVASMVNITGSIAVTFNLPNVANPFYSCIVPMAQLTGLQVGHEINITVLDQTLKVHIAPEGRDHCMLFWENQWGCFDTFECTGEVQVENQFNTTTFKFRKDYKSAETKTLSIETENSFKIDTGWVRSAEEIAGLSKLLKSRNIYVLYKGVLSKVNTTTKKLPLSETNEEEPSFILTFDNALS